MARPTLLPALLLLAALLPAGSRGLPARRRALLQAQGGQGLPPDSSGAAPAREAATQPVGAYPTAGPPSSESSAGPAFTSPYRGADVGSSSAAEVAAAIADGNAPSFAAAAAAAGPEAAGRAVTEAVQRGQGGALARLVNEAGGASAAADAFATVSQPGGAADGGAMHQLLPPTGWQCREPPVLLGTACMNMQQCPCPERSCPPCRACGQPSV